MLFMPIISGGNVAELEDMLTTCSIFLVSLC